MIAVIAPEPVPWLDRAIELAAGRDQVRVLAPWALADRAVWRALARRTDFARRRIVRHARIAWPGWPLAELVQVAWMRGRADRRLAGLFDRRALVDRLAAKWLARVPDLRGVIAPSAAAQRCFAVATTRGARCTLIEDLPGLRQLQEDLDRSAAAHPGCRFLRRYRAPLAVVARQEAEWALAGELLVRGVFAHSVRARAGVDESRLVPWAEGPQRSPRRAPSGTRRILLAGLAAARHGTPEALALLEARPQIQLVVRAGEGFEPRELAAHPRVIAGPGADLTGIDVVIAPSWCEAYPTELGRAAALGIPIVATRRAAGFVDVDAIEPGDAAGLIAAVDRQLSA
jgi:hypothetical protein